MSVARVVVLQTAFLGDILLTTPLLAALESVFPGARREIITTPVGAAALANLACVDTIHILDKRREHRTMKAVRSFAANVAEGGIDILLVPHRSVRSALLAHALRARETVTWSTAAARLVARHVLPFPWAMHEADRNLQLLRPWSAVIPTKESAVINLADDSAHSRAAKLLAEVRSPFVVVASESAWATKQLPEPQATSLIQVLVGKGVQVVRLGSTTPSSATATSGVVDVRGQTSVQEAAAVIARASCVVSVDSASLHMASLQGVPVIGIFGPTVPEYGFGPWGKLSEVAQLQSLQCRPCSSHGQAQCPLRHHHCMTTIATAPIAERAISFVNDAQS